ncbi:MAG TPA: hypothetical protein ENI62_02185 [Gammaproteobacteria bacterium]|nr:hypothetical protein [Gammaproteobacteria bacterium]
MSDMGLAQRVQAESTRGSSWRQSSQKNAASGNRVLSHNKQLTGSRQCEKPLSTCLIKIS